MRNLATGGAKSLAQTLVIGAVTGGEDITLSTGDKLISQTNLELDATSGELILTAPNGVKLSGALGTAGQVFTSQAGSAPTWTTPAAGGYTVSAKTTNYGINASTDLAKFFTNTGATGTITFTLPTAAAGLSFTICVDAVFTVIIQAGASTIIRLGDSDVSTAAGTITANTAGSLVELVAITTTKWTCKTINGSWTAA